RNLKLLPVTCQLIQTFSNSKTNVLIEKRTKPISILAPFLQHLLEFFFLINRNTHKLISLLTQNLTTNTRHH
ncbi:MAG: hypothetical protein ACKO7R_06185, partial [Pseudanabaena sp.]